MIDFNNVETSVRTLKAQFEDGAIKAGTFEARLMDLVALAPDGNYWMFGHQSEKWFRYDGKSWVLDTPPSAAEAPSGEEHAPTPEPSWLDINMSWFVTSVVILVVIGGLVYTSV